MQTRSNNLFIGLMSGTSLDGIDAVLVDFAEEGKPVLVGSHSLPFSNSIRAEIALLCQPGQNEIDRMGELDRRLGQLFAQATNELIAKTSCPRARISAIGSHGQTIRHHPSRSSAFSIQIADPNTIAYLTGLKTVADFRRMDIAAGGQGAPLVPAFHDAVLRDRTENRVIINIGGMANITVLATGQPVTGFDTGPGNVLMDSWIQHRQSRNYDEDGNWAASGACDIALLDQLMSHPYIQAPAPKSTGRESFHLEWLKGVLTAFTHLGDADIQRTLLEFSALSIAETINNLDITFHRALLCGGGSHNSLLRSRIAALLPGIKVSTTTNFGIDADWLEAMAFAWLAKQRIEGGTGNVTTVTGAASPCILGGVYLPPPN